MTTITSHHKTYTYIYLIRYSEVLDGAPSDETLWHLPETITILQREILTP
jgi:hypothetical protein